MEYSDEAGSDPVVGEATDLSNQDSNKAYIIQSYTVKKLSINGITFSTVEFSGKARTFSRSFISQSEIESTNEEKEDSFITMFERNSLNEQQIGEIILSGQSNSEYVSENNLDGYRHAILFGKINGVQEVRTFKST